MSINFNQHKNDLLFIPLGGAGEIGMNFNLYQYKGKWLIADCGAGFAEEFMPGVDMIVPDISFITKYRNDIVGMILTHAHEDHLGAVQYLWDELRCPVYTTPFTASFLKAKLADAGSSFANDIVIHEIASSGTFEVAPFSIEMVHLTHSAPEMNALVIKTEHGSVLHTGDWKFDRDPMVGPAADEERLKSYGDKGILALIGDSTNVFKEGWSGSEGDLRKSLVDLVGQYKSLVAVATFASNVARIETIARAAQANGRKIVLVGRSLWRITRAAKETGYLTDIDFLDDRQAAKYPRHELLLLCTGCQGEPLAAINKLAQNAHPNLKLVPGDTVIFSSKIIPGNDKRIFRLFNRFVTMGIEVVTEKDHFVHVSGHPSRDELKHMYELVRPEIAIPVHGERVHMHEHAKLAREWGIKHALEVVNGDVLRLAPGKPEHLGKVDSGFLGIDGYFLLPPDSNVMRARRKIQRAGAVVVTLLLDNKSQLYTDPIICAPGALDPEEDGDIFEALAEAIAANLRSLKPSGKPGKKGGSASEHIENITRSAVKTLFRRDIGKEPVVEVHVEWIS